MKKKEKEIQIKSITRGNMLKSSLKLGRNSVRRQREQRRRDLKRRGSEGGARQLERFGRFVANAIRLAADANQAISNESDTRIPRTKEDGRHRVN